MNETNQTMEEMKCGLYEGYTLQRFIIVIAFSGLSFFGVLFNTV